MSQQFIDYGQEFDETVNSLNEWLVSLQNPKTYRGNRWQDFLRGAGSIVNMFGYTDYKLFRLNHPLCGRQDLSPEQKEAIALASDWQRVGTTLDKILAGGRSCERLSVHEAQVGISLVRDMYDHFRNLYTSYAIQK